MAGSSAPGAPAPRPSCSRPSSTQKPAAGASCAAAGPLQGAAAQQFACAGSATRVRNMPNPCPAPECGHRTRSCSTTGPRPTALMHAHDAPRPPRDVPWLGITAARADFVPAVQARRHGQLITVKVPPVQTRASGFRVGGIRKIWGSAAGLSTLIHAGQVCSTALTSIAHARQQHAWWGAACKGHSGGLRHAGETTQTLVDTRSRTLPVPRQHSGAATPQPGRAARARDMPGGQACRRKRVGLMRRGVGDEGREGVQRG